ncbi:hypothetical protein CupriaWKF_12475 [Cupriavidus sp. WKF15]|uniref:hypothetical protein n=1 Tax=Cupriavidus sp. WKF15 TaxID=3032282 RepID=UPI0023E174C2|nr:hypothetical protein [Cupriavidus sp. WKF15]WER45123.1 hypothetical protein CupriaWKF_12475 [Cupriavidus sp. WKF15]
MESELEANGYAAVPSWRNDGRWEAWVREGNITSGPSKIFPSREAAIEAGRVYREAELRQP